MELHETSLLSWQMRAYHCKLDSNHQLGIITVHSNKMPEISISDEDVWHDPVPIAKLTSETSFSSAACLRHPMIAYLGQRTLACMAESIQAHNSAHETLEIVP
ncbi:hypothetical protein HAX54_042384 [Datura stramonium]|uniref:Uncharacterized protein n=1 Tax=Datura stramonium TaxID=4076 RepID=A0ABS8VZ53_DATST|nr:hypothetical protein [Datura stramonium]